METSPDGSTRTTHRILTIGVDVETLLENFREITGMDPVFRDSEWTVEEATPPPISPEHARLGG